MKKSLRWVAAFLLSCALSGWWEGSALAAAPTPPDRPTAGAEKPLGSIVLDRENGRFSVPAKILRVEPPLEYAAVGKGGLKAYESFLELETSGAPFNLACVLIGLEAKKGAAPEHQFDARPVEGMRVSLWVEWSGPSGVQRVPLSELLQDKAQKVPDEWVYLGSIFAPKGPFLAETTGTIIGFVHDPIAVIEHRTGLGIGAYGSVGVDAKRCPPAGSQVTLVVERVRQ